MMWDIFDLNDDEEWSHIQILDWLHQNNVDCFYCDTWTDENVLFIVGCKADQSRIADVLNIHRECVYVDYEHCFVFVNLFMEKIMRLCENGNDEFPVLKKWLSLNGG